MSDIIVDSSVVAKWVLPEADSAKAQQLITQTVIAGDQLVVLDLAYAEVANAIWKRYRLKSIPLHDTEVLFKALREIPVRVETSIPLLPAAMKIATGYDRAIYDALFVALVEREGMPGITADEPLFNVVHKDFPEIVLLRDY